MSQLEDLFAAVARGAGIDLVREYRFHPPRRWRFDFADPKHKIAVEIEGGTWIQGAHVRGARYRKDTEKENQALLDGWQTLRFSDKRDFPNFPEMYRQLIQRQTKGED